MYICAYRYMWQDIDKNLWKPLVVTICPKLLFLNIKPSFSHILNLMKTFNYMYKYDGVWIRKLRKFSNYKRHVMVILKTTLGWLSQRQTTTNCYFCDIAITQLIWQRFQASISQVGMYLGKDKCTILKKILKVDENLAILAQNIYSHL
jgi:hypothetical protein